MGIQSLKEFEAWWSESYDRDDFEDVVFSEILNEYESNYIVTDDLNKAWSAWQTAKAQAVSETQQALNDRLLVKSIREQVESHIAEISVNDLFDKGWLAAMKCLQNNIDMLEAQEQTHE